MCQHYWFVRATVKFISMMYVNWRTTKKIKEIIIAPIINSKAVLEFIVRDIYNSVIMLAQL